MRGGGREREKDLTVCFRRFSSQKKEKKDRDSENLPQSQGSGRLDKQGFFFFGGGLFFLGCGTFGSRVMCRPKPRR